MQPAWVGCKPLNRGDRPSKADIERAWNLGQPSAQLMGQFGRHRRVVQTLMEWLPQTEHRPLHSAETERLSGFLRSSLGEVNSARMYGGAGATDLLARLRGTA